MIEFNPDGSIKMPAKLAAHQAKQDHKMQNTECMKVRKEIVSIKPPKTCHLHITLSPAIKDRSFITNIYNYFSKSCETPTKLIQESEKEFRIEIGTTFRRCAECTTLISRYRSFLNSNIIEVQGNCSYKQNMQARFSYEDYFD
ncbi:hypothetical protein ACFL0V_05435 [Nanoarchaeota archaeon]